MKIKFKRASLILGVLLLTGLWTGSAAALVIDFEDAAERQIIDDEYAPGVTISALNVGGGPNLAVIFDSQTSAQVEDTDLKGPSWAAGNLAPDAVLGNLLIIEERSLDSDGDGFIDSLPDDEGTRPAGSIYFDFEIPITEFGFDLIDVEGPDEYGDDSGYFATFFMGGSELARVGFGDFVDSTSSFYISSVVYGNNSANRIDPITAAELGISQFDRVQINFGGSAAIDTINFTPVPEPATMLLLGAGLIGLANLSRRKFFKN